MLKDSGQVLTASGSPQTVTLGVCDQPTVAQANAAIATCSDQFSPNQSSQAYKNCIKKTEQADIQNHNSGSTSTLTTSDVQSDLQACDAKYPPKTKNRTTLVNKCVENKEQNQDPKLHFV